MCFNEPQFDYVNYYLFDHYLIDNILRMLIIKMETNISWQNMETVHCTIMQIPQIILA